MKNLINPFQLKEFDPKLYSMLGQNGFAIVPAEHNQLFHVYEKNDYADFPKLRYHRSLSTTFPPLF